VVNEPAVVLVELGEPARRALARRHPEVTRHKVVFAVGAAEDLRPSVLRAIEELVDAANTGRELRTEELVQDLLEGEAPTAEALEDAKRQANLRSRVVRDFGAYTGKEVAAMAGSGAHNRFQVAHRWKKAGRIFGVPYQGDTVYLRFQFSDDGQPLPVIRDVLRALDGWAPWDLARWFVFRSRRLEQRRPADLLERDPDAVVAAARAERPAAGRGGARDAELPVDARGTAVGDGAWRGGRPVGAGETSNP
jgi:hypothetical protein